MYKQTQVVTVSHLGNSGFLGGFNDATNLHVLIRYDSLFQAWRYDIDEARVLNRAVSWHTLYQDVAGSLDELKNMIGSHPVSESNPIPLVALKGLTPELIKEIYVKNNLKN